MIKKTEHKTGYKGDRKFCLSVVAMAVMFTLILKFLTMTVSTSSNVPLLFINDTLFTHYEKYPLKVVDGFECVPLMYFEQMPGVEIKFTGDAFYVLYQNYHYISFGSQNGLAVDIDRYEFYAPVYVFNGVKYVRVETVCNSLRLTYEFDRQNGIITAWRIKDRTARNSLKELIAAHTVVAETLPTIPPQTKITTDPPHTQPPTAPPIVANIPDVTVPTVTQPEETTAEPTTQENTRSIENYFVFGGFGNAEHQVINGTSISVEDSGETYSGDADGESDVDNNSNNSNYSDNIINNDVEYLLDTLKHEKIMAIFFFTESAILENPMNLRKVYAMGHEVGIEIDGGKINLLPEDLIAELERVNALIHTAVKRKTRFYMLDEDMYIADSGDGVGYQELSNAETFKALEAAGYCRIKETITVSKSQDIQHIYDLYSSGDISYAVVSMTEFLKLEELNIIKFDVASINKKDEEAIEDEGNAVNISRGYLNLIIKAVNSKFYISTAKITLPFFASIDTRVD